MSEPSVNVDSASNRRRSARRSVRMLCQAVRERDFTLVGEVMLDLSAEGLLLRTAKRVYTGDAVIVSFFEPASGRWFDLSATVARVVHARRAGDVERCVALEFEGMSREDRAQLAASLETRARRFPEGTSARPWWARASLAASLS